jgi:hypothetical protein
MGFGKSNKKLDEGSRHSCKNIFYFVFGKAKTLRIFAPSFTDHFVKHTTTKRI